MMFMSTILISTCPKTYLDSKVRVRTLTIKSTIHVIIKKFFAGLTKGLTGCGRYILRSHIPDVGAVLNHHSDKIKIKIDEIRHTSR